MNALRLAILNLTRRRVPTFLALVSIAISVGFSGVLLRLYYLSESRFSTLAKGGDAIVGAKSGGLDILLSSLNLEGSYPGYIPLVLYQSLKQRTDVKFADGEHLGSSYIKAVIPFVFFAKYRGHRVIGTDESFLTRPEPQDSPILSQGKWAYGTGEVVLGSEVARSENLSIGDNIVVTSWTGDSGQKEETLSLTLKVSGIFAASGTAWDRALFSNLEESRKVLAASNLGPRTIWKGDVLNFFLLYLPQESFPSLEALINKRTIAQVIHVADEIHRLEELTGTGRKLGFLMSVLILLLGGLSVAAMMATRFDAMTIQLAVLRALGYERREIRSWLLWEGVLLGVGACLVGALADAILFPLIRGMLGTALPPPSIVHSPIYQSFPVWITAIGATTAAVFIPLFRLYRQDVHLSLKGV